VKSITQQTYDQIAPYFAGYNGQMPENVRQDLLEFLAHLPPNGRVLDLGCGTGRDLNWLEQHPLRLLGADFSIGMLAETRKIVACSLTQMDMRSLGFAARSFDGIWCNAALLHLPKTEAPRALREMRRVLCDDGILDIAVQKGEQEGLEINPYNHVGERFFARYSLDEMTGVLVETGFVVLEASVFEAPHRTWLRFVARVVR
jgi:ubiquinone/menaquinone biosynthesis C-methylase UbiE